MGDKFGEIIHGGGHSSDGLHRFRGLLREQSHNPSGGVLDDAPALSNQGPLPLPESEIHSPLRRRENAPQILPSLPGIP